MVDNLAPCCSNVLLNLWLIPAYGILGAAAAWARRCRGGQRTSPGSVQVRAQVTRRAVHRRDGQGPGRRGGRAGRRVLVVRWLVPGGRERPARRRAGRDRGGLPRRDRAGARAQPGGPHGVAHPDPPRCVPPMRPGRPRAGRSTRAPAGARPTLGGLDGPPVCRRRLLARPWRAAATPPPERRRVSAGRAGPPDRLRRGVRGDAGLGDGRRGRPGSGRAARFPDDRWAALLWHHTRGHHDLAAHTRTGGRRAQPGVAVLQSSTSVGGPGGTGALPAAAAGRAQLRGEPLLPVPPQRAGPGGGDPAAGPLRGPAALRCSGPTRTTCTPARTGRAAVLRRGARRRTGPAGPGDGATGRTRRGPPGAAKLSYAARGRYAEQLDRWYAHVPAGADARDPQRGPDADPAGQLRRRAALPRAGGVHPEAFARTPRRADNGPSQLTPALRERSPPSSPRTTPA